MQVVRKLIKRPGDKKEIRSQSSFDNDAQWLYMAMRICKMWPPISRASNPYSYPYKEFLLM